MKKIYIAPQSSLIKVGKLNILASSPEIKVTNQDVWQYDGDPLQDNRNKNNGQISGPASEYVGGSNDQNPVDEGSIFGD